VRDLRRLCQIPWSCDGRLVKFGVDSGACGGKKRGRPKLVALSLSVCVVFMLRSSLPECGSCGILTADVFGVGD
jgi:hypothetical protein